MNAYRKVGTRNTPATEPILGENQIPNAGGGYVYELDKWATLQRFLVLGTEGGTYYIKEAALTRDAALNVEACIKEDGLRAVATIQQISRSGRAARNDPAIFALAMAISLGDLATKKASAEALPIVCRIGTHLFHFAEYVEQFRGWGRLLKDAVANWYDDQDAERLSYDLVKYRQRDGWGHDDLVKLSHPTKHAALYDWLIGPEREGRFNIPEPQEFAPIKGYEAISKVTDAKEAAQLIKEYRLPRETVPTNLLKDKVVWQALMDTDMPIEAMTRNLGNMGSVGLLEPFSDVSKRVVEVLSDAERIKRSRLHPIKILAAYLTYKQGHGNMGDNKWTIVPQVVDALEEAYYLSFGNVTPTEKPTMLCLDVSGSMGSPLMNMRFMTCAQGTAAMAMVIARTEPYYQILGFANQIVDLGITAKTTLSEAFDKVQRSNFGSTNPAAAIEYAQAKNWKVDSFIIITDNEINSGKHPSQALRTYRQKSGRMAKLSVVGMTATNFTIADPKDRGMADFVGFDTNTPEAISEFVKI